MGRIDSLTSPKRKTIDAFFTTVTQDRPSKVSRTSREDISTLVTGVPGLQLFLNFVTKEEEDQMLTFLDTQDWRTDLSRRVIHYGGTYCLMPPRSATAEEKKAIEGKIIPAEPIPSRLDFLLERMIDHEIYRPSQKPGYCIVNEYRGNQGISAHVENFRFISPVCSLTLGDGDWIRFHELASADDGSVRSGRAAKAIRTGKRLDVWMPSRSLLVMSGDAREKWQHEIVRSRRGRIGEGWRRISLTFRAEKRAKT